ncbi:MAG: hypothetical protein ABIT10_00340, partial [Alteraurantiacibacter sp.]
IPAFAGMTMVCVSLLLTTPALAQDRAVIDASAPSALAVTVYRDPSRGEGGEMNRNWPRGFAMISETRQVTLPPGQSTIRFEGVSEGMVAVSAIVTGLPGGTIEKNRNADLLSPAALVDGTLGNRVRVTRTNPATGQEREESAVIRTRADGGLVLQTSAGFEAVRCAGVPERLAFDRIPTGLSALPVYTIDTADDRGGTYTITLTYLSWGFDWQANYVATLAEGGTGDDVSLRLMSWLTILNDNNQAFPNAELMAVAGTLEVVSDFQSLADPPDARPLQLTCYPLGSTAAGSPIPMLSPPPPPPPMAPMMEGAIVVTAQRREANYDSNSPITSVGAMLAQEEQLGDLKLYRIPQPVTVAAKGLKQVAFLDRGAVEGRLLYETMCYPGSQSGGPTPVAILLATVNDEEHGLGMALPSGAMAVFEPTSTGELLVAAPSLRDYAEGQDVELALGQSTQVFVECTGLDTFYPQDRHWTRMRGVLTNANDAPVTVRLQQGSSGDLSVRGTRSRVKDGMRIVEISVPANGERVVEWQVRSAITR